MNKIIVTKEQLDNILLWLTQAEREIEEEERK